MSNRRDPGDPAFLKRAQAITSGTEIPKIEELFQLISQVNPTDRGLPERQTTDRYKLKTRLQSTLLRHYKDRIAIEASSDEPELVLLRHRVN